MIRREIYTKILEGLARQAAVALLGPRQVGKTTLAKLIAAERPSVYLDLETRADRDKLKDPVAYFNLHRDKLVILDEIHRLPELFDELRGIIDERRFKGDRYGHFLILGSASLTLIKRSSESLAGRLEYVELAPLQTSEIEKTEAAQLKLWLRGGFPDSYLAANETDSLTMRENFIKSYIERDIPLLGTRMPAELLLRFFTMLAHNQGTMLNASRLASSLSLSAPTVSHFISLLSNLMLVRRLQPYHINVGKRLMKSPKIYIRDTGLLHQLLNIRDFDDLLGHPIAGPSFESFAIENIVASCPTYIKPYFYRTTAGAEIDLILDWGSHKGIWAIEIKKGHDPKTQKGFFNATEDLSPAKKFIVYSGQERYPYKNQTEVISINELTQEIILAN